MVPGLRNSGPQHWQTLWQQRLPDAERIRLPQWDQPDLQRWTEAIIAAVRKQRASYIVAHSFGCLATVHALGQIPNEVRGVLLVAPADPDKFNIASVLPQAPLPVPGLVVGSLSDPWLSWTRAQQWAQCWLLPIICAGDAGHINAESGHGVWPEGWELLQRLRRFETYMLQPPHSLRVPHAQPDCNGPRSPINF
jgi:predicted alpha/beta hydrolase family esterase